MFEQISRTRRFGYARVSSQTQEDNSSLEAQKQEFIQKGVPEKNIRIEVGSAVNKVFLLINYIIILLKYSCLGAVGFEPTNDEVKVRGLTAWLYPIHIYII